MAKIVNIGQRFGRLIVICLGEARFSKKTGYKTDDVFICKCDCGKEKSILKFSLLTGKTKSCGCLSRETTSRVFRKHDYTKLPGHNIWEGIMLRCFNPKSTHYESYGGRGITVCERWKNCVLFLEDMWPPPFDSATIDRIDVNGNYEPNNCRWATRKEQSQNTRIKVSLGKLKQMDENNQTIRLWDSIRDAASFLGIGHSGISACLSQKATKVRFAAGFKWEYENRRNLKNYTRCRKKKLFEIIDPNGKVYICANLTQFATKLGLNPRHFSSLVKRIGDGSRFRSPWQCRKLNEEEVSKIASFSDLIEIN